ncbi:MAG: hypothetical protein OXF23_05965 [Candidatus Dadabacteria bacterium]|nr:hypothetical protein [Candidatus Dadabacteria bacterium]
MEYIGLAIAFAVSFWVYSDAKSRGKSTGKAFLWFLGVFAILILFLPLWLITRPKNVKLCSHCDEYYEYGKSDVFCPRCGIELKGGE